MKAKHIITVLFNFSILLSAQNLDTVFVDINNIKMPMINNGTFGKASPLILYDDIDIIFSMGFFLSGKLADTVWSNGEFASERIYHYRPGKYSDTTYNEQYKIYELSINDEPFGESWNEWKNAVDLGAKFYDGDGDGIYNPVDKNGNGKWDEDEDRPDLIGDYTNWTIYNDNVPTSERYYKIGEPIGIEVKQTVFAYYREDNDILNNTIFFRFILENVGDNELLDSVYFGIVADPDIGQYNWDLTGCDRTLNSVFAYKKRPDADYYYGENPPSVFVSLLQGPLVQDDSIDNGVIRNGPFLGEEILYGVKNLEMTSATSFDRGWLKTKDFFRSVRDLLIGGKDEFGNPIVVREFEYGNGDSLGTAADTISPYYMFSGDPVTNQGWINVFETDWRIAGSYGPFKLEKNKQQEIIVALIIGRGTSPLNSIEVTRNYVKGIINFYQNNFTQEPVGIKNDNHILPDSFTLYQNYPNPFGENYGVRNPTTTITYSIPASTAKPNLFRYLNNETQKQSVSNRANENNTMFVHLVVYDILGKEVATLVNKELLPGKYSVIFDGRGLPSGVYFYKLSVGNYSQVRKMILMK